LIPRQRRAHLIVWLLGGPMLFVAALWLFTQRPQTGAEVLDGPATGTTP
jgi:hypothetical protein